MVNSVITYNVLYSNNCLTLIEQLWSLLEGIWKVIRVSNEYGWWRIASTIIIHV